MANYFIKTGEFEEKDKKLIFKGRDIVQIDQNTGEQRTSMVIYCFQGCLGKEKCLLM